MRQEQHSESKLSQAATVRRLQAQRFVAFVKQVIQQDLATKAEAPELMKSVS
jgi:hypothetical protein